MPMIKSSADLRNGYNEISTICHEFGEPVFITKNGKGDLAVMSIEAYEQLVGRFELYTKLQEGLNDVEHGNTRPFSEAMTDIRSRRKR
ncbi:MAG: type II toxin-antitoxin system Phd/YefM family antitoxin [Clostridia bacterium]|nr:type II toxin-antitoxin system Phd/YefM family antitoxin [Clostridia bacterium]